MTESVMKKPSLLVPRTKCGIAPSASRRNGCATEIQIALMGLMRM